MIPDRSGKNFLKMRDFINFRKGLCKVYTDEKRKNMVMGESENEYS